MMLQNVHRIKTSVFEFLPFEIRILMFFDFTVNLRWFLSSCSLKEPPLMKGCWEPNLRLREAQRLFEDQISGPESIANMGGPPLSPDWLVACDARWRMFVASVRRCFFHGDSWREDREADWSENSHGDKTRKTALWWDLNSGLS